MYVVKIDFHVMIRRFLTVGIVENLFNGVVDVMGKAQDTKFPSFNPPTLPVCWLTEDIPREDLIKLLAYHQEWRDEVFKWRETMRQSFPKLEKLLGSTYTVYEIEKMIKKYHDWEKVWLGK